MTMATRVKLLILMNISVNLDASISLLTHPSTIVELSGISVVSIVAVILELQCCSYLENQGRTEVTIFIFVKQIIFVRIRETLQQQNWIGVNVELLWFICLRSSCVTDISGSHRPAQPGYPRLSQQYDKEIHTISILEFLFLLHLLIEQQADQIVIWISSTKLSGKERSAARTQNRKLCFVQDKVTKVVTLPPTTIHHPPPRYTIHHHSTLSQCLLSSTW